MSDPTASAIITIAAAVLGGGGIVAAIITGLFNRRKTNADAFKSTTESLASTARDLTQISKDLATSLYDEVKRAQARIDTLSTEVDALKRERDERNGKIMTLEQENQDLKCTVDKLRADLTAKDRKVAELTTRIKDLEKRLNNMPSGPEQDCQK